MAVRVRVWCFTVACALTLAAPETSAQVVTAETSAGSADEPPPTFHYATPAEPHALRAGIEVGAVIALGFAWYATTSTDIVRDWDVNYSFRTFKKKLTGNAFGPDTNAFGTNFIGHPLGGTAYYLAARSNRLSILQSFAFATAGSFFWELFGEVSEIVSLNDTFVTPLGGVAIGESTLQLAAFFDRSAATTGHRVAGTFFSPFKTLNDTFDDLELVREPRGFSSREWHRFEALVEGALVRETRSERAGPQLWPEARVTLSSRLVRLPGFTRAGSGVLPFDDGNASRMKLELAVAPNGVSDLTYATQAVLAGIYYRTRRVGASGSAYGANGFVGIASGFQYSLHRYARGGQAPSDRWASIQPIGVVFEQRGVLGGPAVVTRLDAGLDYGGVRSFAQPPALATDQGLPPVLLRHGYYFGLGGHGEASVALETERLEIAAELSAEGLRAVGGPNQPVHVRLGDLRSRARGRVLYRIPQSPAALHVSAERRTRTGLFSTRNTSAEELSLGFGCGAVF